ncbi:MAG: cyclase family protein [Candidatus Bathyarchaeia archaeon]
MELKNVLRNYTLVDLTHALEEGTPCYLPYHHMCWMSRRKGDGYNAYVIQVAEHHGTHVDAPSHVGGAKWLEDVDLDVWHGPCRVLNFESKREGEEVSSSEIKRWEKLHGSLRAGDIALLRYGWDRRWTTKRRGRGDRELLRFLRDFPGLSVGAAAYLGERRVKMVGTDTPTVDSVAAFLDAQNLGKVEPAHIKLLREFNIPILEGLKNLDKLPIDGAYLFAFPLNIRQGSGSPVRAVAFTPKRQGTVDVDGLFPHAPSCRRHRVAGRGISIPQG